MSFLDGSNSRVAYEREIVEVEWKRRDAGTEHGS